MNHEDRVKRFKTFGYSNIQSYLLACQYFRDRPDMLLLLAQQLFLKGALAQETFGLEYKVLDDWDTRHAKYVAEFIDRETGEL